MRNRAILIILAGAFALSPALAQAETRTNEQSRFISGTMGALAGALVGGPIGLIAGAALGYSVGPQITGQKATVTASRRATRQARRSRSRSRSAKIVLDCANAANQTNPACVHFFAQRQQRNQGQQMQTGMPANPQQPVYMAAPAQTPHQQAYQQTDPRQRQFNPARNPLVPSPAAFGGGGQYQANLASNYAPGQQNAGNGYANSYRGPAPANYGYGQIQAAPVPLPR
ncbi:MAG: hypothetical protein ACK5JM_13830 [Rhodoblastus sp.]